MSESEPILSQNSRIYYFDTFRAIAISIIVLGHCYFGWTKDYFFDRFFANAITGGSALFVFISGFFLHRVFFRRKVEYKTFLKKKIIAVGVPYLILSSLFLTLFWFVEGRLPTRSLKERLPTGFSFDDFSTIELLFINILTGRHIVAYWYIPFVLALFAMTPIFYSFIRLKFWQQFSITAILFFLAAFLFWRPTAGLNPLHSVLYFTPFYLLGIIYSLKEDLVIQTVFKQKLLLFILLLLSLYVMTDLGQSGNNTKLNPFIYTGIDFMVFQKIILIILILALLKDYLSQRVSILSFVADNSFPVFFIHGWIIALLGFMGFDELVPNNLAGVLVAFLFVFSMSLLCAALTKKILRGYSRFIIGT